MKISHRWLLPALAVSVLLLAACGDKKDEEAAVSDGTSLRASDSVQFIDLAQSAESLQELTSFRFDMTMTMEFDPGDAGEDPLGDAFGAALLSGLGDLSFSGTFASPEEFEVHANAFGEEFGYVQIGDQAWMNEGGGWQPTTPDAAGVPVGISLDDLYGDFLPSEVLAAAVVGTETVNGVEAVHYSFDKQGLIDLASSFGGELSPTDMEALDEVSEIALDMWLADESVPVRVTFALAATGEAGESIDLALELNVYDINDPGLSVEAPD